MDSDHAFRFSLAAQQETGTTTISKETQALMGRLKSLRALGDREKTILQKIFLISEIAGWLVFPIWRVLFFLDAS